MSVDPPPDEPAAEKDLESELPAQPSPWERWLVWGPANPANDDGGQPPLLPWWGRWLIVLGAFVLGYSWRDLGVGQELGWFLAYSALVGMSLAASFSVGIFLINLVLAALWIGLPYVWPLRRREDAPVRWAVHQTVMFLNRQLGHIEALGVWTVLALSLTPQLHVQLPLLVLLYLMGEPLINALASRYLLPRHDRSSGDLLTARRPLIYGATVLGLVFLGLRPWDAQITKLAPLMIAILLGGVFPRLVRHRLRAQRVAGQTSAERQVGADFRRAQRERTRRADVAFGPGLVLVGLLATVGASAYGRHAIDQRARTKLDGAPPPVDHCAPEPGGPVKPTTRMFVVSDSQMHELGGTRFPGQMELSDAFVPVALRPVELDVLSFATLQQFGRIYQALDQHGDLFWAHLGDFADLSCASELERAQAALKVLPAGHLAGISPGNHDMSFTGNFFWGPFWSAACPGGRLEKPGSIDRIEEFARSRLAPGGALVRSGRRAPVLGFGARGGALSTVTPLGTILHRGRSRALVAVFLDSADGGAFDLGVAGLFGTLSRGQSAEVKQTISALVKDPRFSDPIYLVFAHHPHGEMSPWSATRLDELLGWLDSNPPVPGGAVSEPRTLALVTAHTHHAESHRQCIDGHALREIVVGATIDPPQQASLLELGPDARGRASLRLRTLQAVSRTGFTCGADPAIDAAACRRVSAQIAKAPECQALVEEPDPPGADCRSLERRQSVQEKLAAIALLRGSTTPKEILDDQTKRTQRLLGCLCRGGRCPAFRADDDTILQDARYQAVLEGMVAAAPDEAERRARQIELACFSWAAASVQAHKASGMSMREALRCAFDDETLAAAQETVATLEERPCR